jgi:hypothetical protein
VFLGSLSRRRYNCTTPRKDTNLGVVLDDGAVLLDNVDDVTVLLDNVDVVNGTGTGSVYLSTMS